MNWNTEGKACFACLALIMNHLLKLPLNSEREGRKIFIADSEHKQLLRTTIYNILVKPN